MKIKWWWQRPTGKGVVKPNKKMNPTTKEAALATIAAGKELFLNTTETVVALFQFTVKFCILTYHLGQDARIQVERGQHYLNTWLAEKERKKAKLLSAAPEVEAENTPETDLPDPGETETDLNELTLKQLKELAEGLNIANFKRLKKAELVKALEAHKTQTEHPESPENNDPDAAQTDTQTHPGQSDTPLESQGHHTVVPSYGLIGAPVG